VHFHATKRVAEAIIESRASKLEKFAASSAAGARCGARFGHPFRAGPGAKR